MSASVKENIKNTAMELIQLKLKDTMLNLVYDMCDLHLSAPEREIPSSISEFIDKIRDYAKGLSSVLENDLSERDGFIKELTTLRSSYVKECIPLYLYINVLNKAGSYGMWQYKCKSAEQMPVNSYHSIEQSVRGYIDEYISDADSLPEKHYRMSRVISLIPLRMPRERYYDLVKAGLRATMEGSTASEAEAAARLLKMGCYPMSTEGYGTLMPEAKTIVEDIYSRPIDKLGCKDLETYLGEVDSAMENLHELADYLNIAYNDINHLISLASFCIDEEYLTDEDILLKDVLYSCRDMLESGDYDLYAEALSEKTADRIEEHFDRLRELDSRLSEYVSRYIDTDNMDEQTMGIVGTYINIHTLYTMELADEFTNVHEEGDIPVEEKCINEKIRGVIDFMESVPDSISSAKNKFFRRDFLSALPVIMSDNDFNEYLDYALEPLRGKAAGVAAITDLCNMLIAEDIIPDGDDDEEECDCGHHHSHNHTHSCTCGHEHSHPHLHVLENHGCDCGHDHGHNNH